MKQMTSSPLEPENCSTARSSQRDFDASPVTRKCLSGMYKYYRRGIHPLIELVIQIITSISL